MFPFLETNSGETNINRCTNFDKHSDLCWTIRQREIREIEARKSATDRRSHTIFISCSSKNFFRKRISIRKFHRINIRYKIESSKSIQKVKKLNSFIHSLSSLHKMLETSLNLREIFVRRSKLTIFSRYKSNVQNIKFR